MFPSPRSGHCCPVSRKRPRSQRVLSMTVVCLTEDCPSARLTWAAGFLREKMAEAAARRSGPGRPRRQGHRHRLRLTEDCPLLVTASHRATNPETGQLPAEITDRVGRSRRAAAAPSGARVYTFADDPSTSPGRTRPARRTGLDLYPPTFAPCLLGCPGTGRQNPVLTSLRLAGLRYSSACHSVSVTQVFKKLPLSSGLLIRWFGVQVPGGAPGLAWGFITPGHFYVSVSSPWLLRGCSRARTLQSGSCQKRPNPAPTSPRIG